MSAREIFTVVSATATAETRFKSVTFNVTTKSVGPDSAASRVGSDTVLKAVMATIDELNDRGVGIDQASLKCAYATAPYTKYNRATQEHEEGGYQTTGSVVCSTDLVDKATVIMDALSRIDGATVQQPQFTVDDSREASEAAFRAAYAKAMSDFEMQCRVLGVKPSDYEIESYSPADEMRHGGPVRALGAAVLADMPESAPAEIRAGTATTSAFVSLTFVRRMGTGRPRPLGAEEGAKGAHASNGQD